MILIHISTGSTVYMINSKARNFSGDTLAIIILEKVRLNTSWLSAKVMVEVIVTQLTLARNMEIIEESVWTIDLLRSSTKRGSLGY